MVSIKIIFRARLMEGARAPEGGLGNKIFKLLILECLS